jgi:hypothetical protein
MSQQKYTDFLNLRGIVLSFFDVFKSEKRFVILIAFLLIAAASLAPFAQAAMWFGFLLAAYSAVANDSIQTIGTFIVSNKNRKWYILWLYIGVIFLITVTYSFIVFNGDVSYQRLQTPGLDQAPQSFSFLQLLAPIILIVLTRMRMPVSTTFLLLTVFSTQSSTIVSVLTKSVSGYVLAFFVSIIVWFLVRKLVQKKFKGKPHFLWMVFQWITSGALWSVWVMQDAANIAVFLPRELTIVQFIVFAGAIFLGLGLLFYLRGDRIQQIVNEKSGISDIRSATMVDFVYALILIYFKQISEIPMSTTWVFLGLLAGRELAISITKKRQKKRIQSSKKTFVMIMKDLLMASIGLIVSLILAIAINEQMRDAFMELF